VGYCYDEAPVATSPRKGICDNVKSHYLALSSLSVTDYRPVLDPCVVVVTPVTTDSHRRLRRELPSCVWVNFCHFQGNSEIEILLQGEV
jgi:hypothetical protein